MLLHEMMCYTYMEMMEYSKYMYLIMTSAVLYCGRIYYDNILDPYCGFQFWTQTVDTLKNHFHNIIVIWK